MVKIFKLQQARFSQYATQEINDDLKSLKVNISVSYEIFTWFLFFKIYHYFQVCPWLMNVCLFKIYQLYKMCIYKKRIIRQPGVFNWKLTMYKIMYVFSKLIQFMPIKMTGCVKLDKLFLLWNLILSWTQVFLSIIQQK